VTAATEVKSTASVVGTGGESDGGRTVIRGRRSSLSAGVERVICTVEW
jgi:hypothetical protein